MNHYLKQFKFAHGSLDIIVVDTGLDEVASNGAGDRQSQWLIDTLENSENKWCIAIGLHPLVAYEEDTPQMKLKPEFQSLHGVFLKYGVVSQNLNATSPFLQQLLRARDLRNT